MLTKPLFVANWKMNMLRFSDEQKVARSIVQGVKKLRGKKRSVIICPSFLGVAALSRESLGSVVLGAQDCFWEEKGAYTGEISAKMLGQAGCQAIILGHSERRRYLLETDKMIHGKLSAIAALKGTVTPIVCVGETALERKNGETLGVIGHQLRMAFNEILFSPRQEIVVAYEPVWAIGSGRTVSADDCAQVYSEITSLLALWYPTHSQRGRVKVIYGGSVTKTNVFDFVREGVADGVLVGGASLKSAEFLSLIKAC